MYFYNHSAQMPVVTISGMQKTGGIRKRQNQLNEVNEPCLSMPHDVSRSRKLKGTAG
jgi:hypothetical protein